MVLVVLKFYLSISFTNRIPFYTTRWFVELVSDSHAKGSRGEKEK